MATQSGLEPATNPLGGAAPELDEDFERMLHDIAGSNRREQELANQLLNYMTAL